VIRNAIGLLDERKHGCFAVDITAFAHDAAETLHEISQSRARVNISDIEFGLLGWSRDERQQPEADNLLPHRPFREIEAIEGNSPTKAVVTAQRMKKGCPLAISIAHRRLYSAGASNLS